MWLDQLIMSMNVFGLGPEPVVLALAGALTVAVNIESIKQRDWLDAALMFNFTWLIFFAAGLATNMAAYAVYTLIVFVGMVMTHKDAERVSHTVTKA